MYTVYVACKGSKEIKLYGDELGDHKYNVLMSKLRPILRSVHHGVSKVLNPRSHDTHTKLSLTETTSLCLMTVALLSRK